MRQGKKMVLRKLKDPKYILIIVLAIFFIVLIIYKIQFWEKKSFQIEDKCGNFVNLMSHTIKDESGCESRCRSQCKATDYSFSKVIFKINEQGCNNCTCFCR